VTRTPLLLLACVLGIAAEGAPATPPVEPPPVEPPPVEPPAVEPPPAGAAGTATPAGRLGTRVARVAGRAPTWDARLRLGAGWDSNALLDSDPDTVRSATAVYSGEGGLGWRPIADEQDYLKANLIVAYDRRPHLERLDTARLSLGLAGASQGQDLTIGGSLNAGRYWLDGDGAAAELRGGASLGWIRSAHADLLALEIGAIHFDATTDREEGAAALAALGDADDRSGVIVALAWRHWWILGAGSRVEAAVRAGSFSANTAAESYRVVQPWLALRVRPDGWDLQARATLEGRAYDAERSPGSGTEQAAIASLTASADRLLVRGLWVGAQAGASARMSDDDTRDYDRWQAGLRLTYSIESED
jgi:hypothetical protein